MVMRIKENIERNLFVVIYEYSYVTLLDILILAEFAEPSETQ